MYIVHCVSKQNTDVAHYNFNTHPPNLAIFGRDVAERVCYPPLLTNVSVYYLEKRWNAIIAFFSHAVLVHCHTSTVADLIYSVSLLTTHAVAAVWLPKFRRHWSYALNHCGAIAQKERKMGVLHCSSWTWTVMNAISISAPSCWKIKLPSMTHFIASNICWDSKISQQYCLLVFTLGLVKNNPHFDTVIDTVTDMVIVDHVGDM